MEKALRERFGVEDLPELMRRLSAKRPPSQQEAAQRSQREEQLAADPLWKQTHETQASNLDVSIILSSNSTGP